MKSIKLAENHDIKHSVVLIDSRVCLIDSLINELKNCGRFSQVHYCGSIKQMLMRTEIKGISKSMVVLSMDVFNTTNQNSDIGCIRGFFGDSTPIVFLVDRPCIDLIRFMTKHNISGVIPSSYSTEQATACLTVIDAGVNFIPSKLLAENVSQPFIHRLTAKNNSHELYGTLTPRQAQVLELLCTGRSNKYIAAELSLCESTVKVHVSEIMKRMGATSRTHASYLYGKILDRSDNETKELATPATHHG